MNDLIKTRIESLIRKYYREGEPAFEYYYSHVKAVADLAVAIAGQNPGLNANTETIWQMAMVHDIGIRFTRAPEIGCHGHLPYLAHGYKGREIMEAEGFAAIAPICERHIGVGISCEEVISQNLPLPERDMLPVTIEEEIVCYADKFFSKTAENPTQPKPLAKIRKGLQKYGDRKMVVFDRMVEKFGSEYIYNGYRHGAE